MTAMTDTDRSRWIALYVLCAGVLMIVLDVTIVNVALPAIQEDLGFTQTSLAWVVNGYLIAFGGLLLLSGRLGDLIGRRTVFLAGIGVFTVASLLCGLAGSQELLVAARFLQGIGGAMASAVTLGMIVTMFPEEREQAKAIGVFAFVASAGGAIGLLVGGVVAEAINWHWIFIVNVPIGAATYALAARLLAADRGIGLDKGADVPGAVLITGALMLLVYTIVGPAAEDGWTAGSTLGLAAVSVALFAGFVVREMRAEHPLVPLGFLRSRRIAGTNAIQVLSVVGMFGSFFLGALYLQKILGYDALDIGLAFLPDCVLMAVVSLKVTDRLIVRFGPRQPLVAGLALVAVATALFARVPVDGTYVDDLLPVMVLFGIGAGLAFPALMAIAMKGATEEDAGLTSGLINTTAEIGAALGLAMLATLAAGRTESRLASGASEAVALTSGYSLALLIGAALTVAAIAVALFVLEGERREQPAREGAAVRPATT